MDTGHLTSHDIAPAAAEDLFESWCQDLPPGSVAETVQWLDDMRARNHIFQKRIGLNTLADWGMDRDGRLVHKERKFFSIMGVRITSQSREVTAWDQPILDNVGTGVIGLLLKREDGITSLLMQAKAEVGNRNNVQIAPTVQFTRENYADSDRLAVPFLFEEFMRPLRFLPVLESRQSEEGARFYQEQHIHRVLMLKPGDPLEIPPEFRWMTYPEIRYFLHFGEQVNSCARSILACLV